MVALYSWTRFFCHTSLPVFASRTWNRHFGSSEKTSFALTEGTVLDIPWFGRMSTGADHCHTSLPEAREMARTRCAFFVMS